MMAIEVTAALQTIYSAKAQPMLGCHMGAIEANVLISGGCAFLPPLPAPPHLGPIMQPVT
jgi:hypothetical protein